MKYNTIEVITIVAILKYIYKNKEQEVVANVMQDCIFKLVVTFNKLEGFLT